MIEQPPLPRLPDSPRHQVRLPHTVQHVAAEHDDHHHGADAVDEPGALAARWLRWVDARGAMLPTRGHCFLFSMSPAWSSASTAVVAVAAGAWPVVRRLTRRLEALLPHGLEQRGRRGMSIFVRTFALARPSDLSTITVCGAAWATVVTTRSSATSARFTTPTFPDGL